MNYFGIINDFYYNNLLRYKILLQKANKNTELIKKLDKITNVKNKGKKIYVGKNGGYYYKKKGKKIYI